jgi:hypothetical protein
MLSSTKGAIALLLFGCTLLCSAQTTPPASWTYSTYFGGSQSDTISAVTRDTKGNVYVAGTSTSSNFPTTAGVYEPAYPGPAGYNAVFVSKFSAAGSLLWSTFVGPGSFQFIVASAIQVDADQNVFVAGIFQDPGFPTTPGLGNHGSVFVFKLNSTASQLLYGGTMGPNSILSNPKLVLDSQGDAFVTGSGGAGDCCNGSSTGIIGPLGGIDDFWIAEINTAGTAVTWSVQIGGSDIDEAYGLAIDSANKLYVTGYTGSRDFPTTAGALYQPGTGRAFVAKLDPSKNPASSLLYAALAGNPGNNGNDFLSGQSIAVDQSGNAYVGSWTYNLRLFTSKFAFQKNAPTVPSAYVFELNSSGSSIVNGTYLGGGGDDFTAQVSVDANHNTYVVGFTNSWDFPTTAYSQQRSLTNVFEGYYVKLNPHFAAVSSVEYGGTTDGAEGYAGAPDGAGGLWAAGYAGSQFPTTANAYQPSYQGNYDGYLLHTDMAGLCPSQGVEICTISADNTSSERTHFTSQAGDVEDAVRISLSIDGMSAYAIDAAQFDTWLPVAPGNHFATVSVEDGNGGTHQDQQQFSVAASASCPLNPVAPSLTFCSPLNAAVVHGPVSIQVQANDSVPPKAVRLYVDGNLQSTLQNQNGSYTARLNLPTGIHHLTVQGTDSSSNSLATTAVVHVAP